MSSYSTTQTTINHQQLTNRILNANSLHFILLSLLFLPFTVSASAAVQFFVSEFDPYNLFLINTINLLAVKTLITVLASACFVILPTVAGVALITCSTDHVIHHKPLTFSSTLKSLSHQDTGLLYRVIVRSIKLIILLLAVPLSLIAVIEAIKAALAYHSDLFFFSIFINVTVSYVLAIVILFFRVICEPRQEITMIESNLQNANQATHEFRLHTFSMVFRTGLTIAPAVSYWSVSQNSGPTANWILIMQLGTICLQSSLIILLYVVEITVHCRGAVGGEEIRTNTTTTVEEELSGEYVRLVLNDADGEVANEEVANGGFNYILGFLTIVWVILLFVQFYYIFTFNKKI